ESAPDFVSGIDHHQSGNHSTHAVADQNNRFPRRKRPLYTIEVTTEEHRRIGIGVTTGISEKPELILFPDPPIIAQCVNHRRPACWRILQTVDKKDRGSLRIEMLQLKQSFRGGVRFWTHQSRKSKSFRTLASHQHGERSIKVSRQRKNMMIQGNAFSRPRIDEIQF